MISGTVVCVIIRIIAKVFFHRLSYGDYCRDRQITERGCTVWAKVRHLRVVRVDLLLDHLILCVSQVNYGFHRINRMLKRNLSQGAKSRIAHSIRHLWSISRRHSERKSPIEQEFSPYTSGRPNFLPLNFGRVHLCDSSFKQLRYVHPRLFCSLKNRPLGDRAQVAPRIEDGSVTEITGICRHQLLSIFKPTHLELRLLQWLL